MQKQIKEIGYEGACDQYYILNMLKVNMYKPNKKGNKLIHASQEDVISSLLYGFTSMGKNNPMSYQPSTHSRLFTAKLQFSETVVECWRADTKRLITNIQSYIITAMPQWKAVVETLIQAYVNDEYISEEEKFSFQENFRSKNKVSFSQTAPSGEAEWAATVIAYILLSALKTNYPSRDLKTQQLIRTANPIERLVNYVPEPCTPFLGREEELLNLDSLLEEKKHVFLHGIPGYGKSELAKAYAHNPRYKEKYCAIVYIAYSGSLKRDIANLQFSGENLHKGTGMVNLPAIIMGSEKVDALLDYEYEIHMNYLRRLSDKYLVIIDHFDALPFPITQAPESSEEEAIPFRDDPQISNILQLPCRLLFCTRCNPGFWEPAYASRCLELKALASKSLTQLVTHFFPQAPSYKDEVSGMIGVLEGNTLLVKLAAILFHTSAMEPAQILQKLKEENLAMGVSDPIGAEIKGNYRRDPFAVHARALFRLYLLSDNHKDVLRNMALMPPCGIYFRRFCSWLKLENAEPINDLLSMGLLSKDQEEKIFLHSLIQQAAKEETRPSIENCSILLDSFSQLCLEFIGKKKVKIADELNAIFNIASNIREEGSLESAEKYAIFLENAIPYLYQHSRVSEADELVDHTNDFLMRAQVGSQVDHVAMEILGLLREDKPIDAIILLLESINSFEIPLLPEARKMLLDGLKLYVLPNGNKHPPLRTVLLESLSGMGNSRWMRILLYGITLKLERIQESDRLKLKLELEQREVFEHAALPQPETFSFQEKENFSENVNYF